MSHRCGKFTLVKANLTRRNQLKLIDYFISRIKFYANGGKLDTSNAEEVTEKHIEQEVKKKI